MTPDAFFPRIVAPTLDYMAASPGIAIPRNQAADVLVMTIAGQESRWTYRRQIGGPARSYWQFEKGGGVSGVLNHPSTTLKAKAICGPLDIESDMATVYEAMAWNDTLACAMARLLLWTDPAPLPAVGDKEGAWQYYLRTWRPGMPHPETWSGLYDQSLAAMAA